MYSFLVCSLLTVVGCVLLEETSLEKSRLSGVYRGRLSEGYSLFLNWMGQHHPGSDLDHISLQLANQILVNFVNHLWNIAPTKFSVAKHAILSVQHQHLRLKGNIVRVWQCLQSWRFKCDENNRVPMSLDVLEALFGVCVAQAFAGNEKDRGLWLSLGVLLRVGFFGLCRPGELLALTASQVKVVTTLPSWQTVISVLKPKNRGALGRVQFRLADDHCTATHVSWLVDGLNGSYKIWGSSRDRCMQLYKTALKILNLESVGYTLASLRAGGATHLYLCGKNIDFIQFRGGWACQKSLSCYVQEAMVSLISARTSSTAANLVQEWRVASASFWKNPPNSPWESLFSRKAQWTPRRKLKSLLKGMKSSQP